MFAIMAFQCYTQLLFLNILKFDNHIHTDVDMLPNGAIFVSEYMVSLFVAVFLGYNQYWPGGSMVKLLTDHHLEFLTLTGGCTGSTEPIHVKCHTVGNHMSRLIFLNR